MAFMSNDREMERIYQQSLHPESLEDEKVIKTDIRVKTYNHNESKIHQNRNIRKTKKKKTNKALAVFQVIAILIIVLIYIGMPLLGKFKDIILYQLGY